MAFKELDELAHAGPVIELLPHDVLGCPAKLPTKLGIDDEPPQSFAEGFGIFGLDHKTILFIAQQLGDARYMSRQADKTLA